MLKSAISHDLMGVGRTNLFCSVLKLRLGLILLMGAGLLVACSGGDDPVDPNGGGSGGGEKPPAPQEVQVRFSSALSGWTSRAANGSWEANDQVGVYMIPHVASASAANLSSAYTGAANVPYVISGSGASVSLAVASGQKAIVYPADGSQVNFVAYYPYRSANSNTYNVDVSNQSSAKAIDLLYHKGAGTAYNKNNKDVALAFTHQLSKLKISIVPASGVEVDLTGVTLTLTGFPATADFNLSTGTLSNLGGTNKSLTPVKDAASSSGRAAFEAIVVPHSGASYTRSAIFTVGGKAYPYSFSDSDVFEAGVARDCGFEFTGDAIVLAQNTIVDWGDNTEDGGDYLLTVDKSSFDLDARQTSGNIVTILTDTPSAPVWTLSNDANTPTTNKPDWITGVSLSNPTDDNGLTRYTLTFGTSSNTGAVSRTGYIRLAVAGKTLAIRVTQTAFRVDEPTPASIVDLPAAGKTGHTFTLTTTSTITAPTSLTTTDPSMIKNLNPVRSVQDAANGIYLWTVTFDVSANGTSTPRSASIAISIDGIVKTVHVSQRGGLINVNDGLANCYMVVPGGSVTIPITRAVTIGGLSASADAKVETLWDDNNVISGNPTLSGSGASRAIAVTASSNEGNAVVALKDNDGTICWSWHIWVTNYTGSATWTNPYVGYTLMDRNLGATDNQLNLASRGLFYQWGRKDPFPGGKAGTAGYAALSSFKGMPDTGTTTINYVINKSANLEGVAAGIAQSIENPTTFYCRIADTWLPADEKTLWNTSAGKKSVYDPCPEDWRVPRYRSGANTSPWYQLTGQEFSRGDNAGCDWSYPPDYKNGFYPASGARQSSNGAATDIGERGIWHATYNENKRERNQLTITYQGWWWFSRHGRDAEYDYAASVRCSKDY
jgi:hypothetical protein